MRSFTGPYAATTFDLERVTRPPLFFSSVKVETVDSKHQEETGEQQQQEAKESPPYVRMHPGVTEFWAGLIIFMAERKGWTR